MIKNYFSANGKPIAAENSLFIDKRRGYPARIYIKLLVWVVLVYTPDG